jgi:HK97 family phage major capsid protein
MIAQAETKLQFMPMQPSDMGEVMSLESISHRHPWTQGNFLDSLTAGQPATLMGYRVLVSEDMPDVGANAYPIAFGDFGAGYTIAERPDLRILRDPFSAKPNVLFYASKRVGGDVTDYAAIKLLKVAVS